MERTALRLATVAALLNGGNEPWPTVAGEYVYDSLLDDVVDVIPARRKPVIIVRTDDDEHLFRGYQISGRQCRLLIEIGVLTASTYKLSTGQELPKVDWPPTDSALEAFLDMLEWQVLNALYGFSDWALWYKEDMKYGTVGSLVSLPRYSAPDRGAVRLAVRTLQLACALPPECIAQPRNEYDGPTLPFLPMNYINVVGCIIMKGNGAFKKSVLELKRTIDRYGPVPTPTYPAFQRVWAELPKWNIEAEWRIEQAVPFISNGIITQKVILGKPYIASS